jgi:hypothetical protein
VLQKQYSYRGNYRGGHYRSHDITASAVIPSPRYRQVVPIPAMITADLPWSPLPCHPLVATWFPALWPGFMRSAVPKSNILYLCGTLIACIYENALLEPYFSDSQTYRPVTAAAPWLYRFVVDSPIFESESKSESSSGESHNHKNGTSLHLNRASLSKTNENVQI